MFRANRPAYSPLWKPLSIRNINFSNVFSYRPSSNVPLRSASSTALPVIRQVTDQGEWSALSPPRTPPLFTTWRGAPSNATFRAARTSQKRFPSSASLGPGENPEPFPPPDLPLITSLSASDETVPRRALPVTYPLGTSLSACENGSAQSASRQPRALSPSRPPPYNQPVGL